jgi:excisionase family DNA binding protein
MTTQHRRTIPGTHSKPPAPEAVSTARVEEPADAPPDERLAYSVDEAARLTGLSRDLLYDQMRSGNLDFIKVGRRRLITRQHLERFLDITPRTVLRRATASEKRN